MSQVYGRKKHHRPWTTFHSGRGNRLGQEKHGERTITNADELAFVPYINQIIKKKGNGEVHYDGTGYERDKAEETAVSRVFNTDEGSLHSQLNSFDLAAIQKRHAQPFVNTVLTNRVQSTDHNLQPK